MLRTVGKRLCSTSGAVSCCSSSSSSSHAAIRARDAVVAAHRVRVGGGSIPSASVSACSSSFSNAALSAGGKSSQLFINATRRAPASPIPEFRSFSTVASASWNSSAGDGRVEQQLDGGPKWSVSSSQAQSHARVSRVYASSSSIPLDGGDGGIGRSGGDQGGSGGSGGGGGGGSAGKGASGEAGEGGFWGWWAWYLAEIDRNPLRTKALTTAILNFVGDVVCQVVVEKADPVDWYRTAVLSFVGFALVGPSLHFWYQVLSKVVKVQGAANVAVRLVLDQALFCPVFIGIVLGAIMGLEGHADKFPAKMKADWWSIVKANWLLWVPAQIINFGFVPLKLQVAVANLTGLVWNGYLSYRSHSSSEVPEVSIADAKTA